MSTSQSAPNAEQVRYWNELAGPNWIAQRERLDRLVGPLGERALARAAAAAGEAVLDVGCGCGSTSLALGRAVGPAGRVLGLDVSRPMLEHARARVSAEGLSQLRFVEADAQVAALEPAGFDLLFSRFGVMFFADPQAAFANLRRALRPGARVTFLCWQALARNPWMTVPLSAVAKHLTLPPPPAPGAPGPFAFADADRVRGFLERAGLVDVACEDLQLPLAVGGGELESAIEFLLQVGPVGALLREAAAGPELRERVAGSLREALAPFTSARGIHMPSAAWLVTARNPGR
jgi:SAM-dependent methyltransferase